MQKRCDYHRKLRITSSFIDDHPDDVVASVQKHNLTSIKHHNDHLISISTNGCDDDDDDVTVMWCCEGKLYNTSIQLDQLHHHRHQHQD